MSDKGGAAAFEASGFSDLTSNQALRIPQALLPLLPGVLTVLAT